MIECSGSPGGMAACLRDRIADLGLLPRQAVAEVEIPDPAEPGDADIAAADGPAVGGPEMPAIAEVAEVPATPEMNLISAAPDGTLVIAGTGPAGGEVSVYADGELLGVATAAPSGDWALVPDEPLPTGETIITASAEPEGEPGQIFIVDIADDRAGEPTVVAVAPERVDEMLAAVPEPVEVAAVPEAPLAEVVETPVPATPEAEVAAVKEPAVVPEPALVEEATAAAETPEVEPPLEDEIAVAALPEPTPPEPVAPEFAPVVATPAVPAADARARDEVIAALLAPRTIEPLALLVGDVPAVEVDVVPEPKEPAVDVAVVPETTAPVEPALDAAIADPFTIVPEVPAPALEVAAVEPEAVAAPELVAAAPVMPPTIEAIEIDGMQNFFAGAGEEDALVRLYVDGVAVGESIVEDGRWLVEAAGALLLPRQRVRAEMLRDGSVVARAEVDFVIDMPAPEQEPAEAQVAIVDPEPEVGAETEAVIAAEPDVTVEADVTAASAAEEPAIAAGAPEDRARIEVDVALASPRVVERGEVTVIEEPGAVESSAEVAEAAEPGPAVVATGMRARSEVAVALASPRVVEVSTLPVPDVAEASVPAPAEPDVATAAAVEVMEPEPSAISPELRAATEVAIALEAPRFVRPVESPRLEMSTDVATADPAARASDDVARALAAPRTVEPGPAAETAVAEAGGPTIGVPVQAAPDTVTIEILGKVVTLALSEEVTVPASTEEDGTELELIAEELLVAASRAETTARAEREVLMAMASPRTVAPVVPATTGEVVASAPAEEPASDGASVPDVAVGAEPERAAADPPPTVPSAGDRALTDVALALAAPRMIEMTLAPPVAMEPAPEAVTATVEPEVASPEVATVAPAEPEVPEPEAPAAGQEVAAAPAEPQELPDSEAVAEVPDSPSIVTLETPATTPSVVVAETPDAPEVPTLRAVPSGEGRFTSGQVIIRRGDTLWEIAERVWGKGWLYQRIYRANRDKMPRPGRLYPGQVIDIPPVNGDR